MQPSNVWERHPDQMRMKHCFRKLCDWIEVPDDVLDVMIREDERDKARRSTITQESAELDRTRPELPPEERPSELAGAIRGTESQ